MVASADAVLASLVPPAGRPEEISKEERLARLEKARKLTAEMGADALLIGAGTSLDYFAGLPGGASERLKALFLPVKGEPFLVCPYFEQGSFAAEIKIPVDFRMWQEHESPYAAIADAMKAIGGTRLAIDPGMGFHVAYALGHETGLDLMDGTPVIEGCRQIKTQHEIDILKYAMNLTLQVEKAVPKILYEGITTSEVSDFIHDAHRALGAPEMSFCIVQFGRGSAFPHGLPGVQKLQKNDLVLVDIGAYVHSYSSDLTRTYAFGTPTDEMKRIWDLEKQAEQTAFDAVKIGAPCESVDAAVRAFLAKNGLGPDYKLPGLPHRVGHGIGMDVHESPYIVKGYKTPIAPGMCFSDEPMIVIPDKFGIRLEDHIYVTEKGPAWFTEPQKSIFEV